MGLRRIHQPRGRLSLIIALGWSWTIHGCPGGGGDGTSGLSTGSSGTSSGSAGIAVSTTEVADSTIGGDSTGGSTAPFDCEPSTPLTDPVANVVGTDFLEAMDPAVVCPIIAGGIPGDIIPSIRVIRPAIDMGGWPSQKLPAIVFSPGAGQSHDLYDHLFDPLANAGFVSFLVETSRVDETENLSPSDRANILACALRWIAIEWEEREHLNCDLVLVGHSRGGGAAYILAGNIEQVPWDDLDPEGITFELEALVSIAGASTPDDGFSGQPVPFLGLMGATDEDPVGQGILQYDRIIPDEDAEADPNGLPPKFMLLPYDVPHNAWGGGVQILGALPPTLTPSSYQDKADAIWLTHTPLFLDWVVLGQNADLARTRLSGEDMPPELQPPQWWDYIQPAYTELNDGPIIPRAYTVDTTAPGAQRFIIDEFESGKSFDPTSFFGIWELGPPPDSMSNHGWQGLANHRSQALFIEWGDDPSSPGPRGGSLEWPLGLDASAFEYLSLRVANLSRGTFGIPPSGMPCELEASSPNLTDAITFEVSLVDDTGPAQQSVGPVIQQEVRTVVQNTGMNTINKCVIVNFPQTLRLPLSEFAGIDLTNLQSLALTFNGDDEVAAVLIDTLEFTTE